MKELVRPFGVELEFFQTGVNMPLEQAVNALQAVGLEAKRESYNHKRRKHWKAVQDTSIRVYDPNTADESFGGEVASPVLRGEPGIEEARKAADALRDAGLEVNNQCGTHVHFGLRGFGLGAGNVSAAQKKKELVVVGNFVKNWMILERAADMFQPAFRRGNASPQYARSIALPRDGGMYYSPEYVEQQWGRVDTFIASPSLDNLQRMWGDDFGFGMSIGNTNHRAGKINLASMYDSHHHGTIEVRHLHGTLNSAKIEAWIRWVNDIWIASAEGKVPGSLYIPQNELLDWAFDYLETEAPVSEYLKTQANLLGGQSELTGRCAECSQDFNHCMCGRGTCAVCSDDNYRCGCCQVCARAFGECRCCETCETHPCECGG